MDRVAASVLDRLERAAGMRGIAVHELRRGGGLHIAGGERVRHHVVQVAGDAHSLLLGASLGLLLARSLGEVQLIAQECDVGAVGAVRLGREQRDGDQHHMSEGLQQRGAARVEGVHDDDGRDRGDRGKQLRGTAAAERERVERDRGRDDGGRARGRGEVKQHQRQCAGRCERPPRGAPAPQQRGRGAEPHGHGQRSIAPVAVQDAAERDHRADNERHDQIQHHMHGPTRHCRRI
jgi:hypothetical protein